MPNVLKIDKAEILVITFFLHESFLISFLNKNGVCFLSRLWRQQVGQFSEM